MDALEMQNIVNVVNVLEGMRTDLITLHDLPLFKDTNGILNAIRDLDYALHMLGEVLS